MKARDAYPRDTAFGCCFLLKSSTIHPGDKILDTGRDLEDFPPHGRICFSTQAVRAMVDALGMKIEDEKASRKIKAQDAEIARLQEQLAEARTALENVLRAAAIVEEINDAARGAVTA